MTRFTANLLSLAVLATVLLGQTSTAWAIANDVNGDGQIDVVDVQCVVLTILGPGLPDCLATDDAADLNCSGETDVVDYQLMVLVVLSHPAYGIPVDKDTNNNNVHDDCESGVDPFCGDGECNGNETCDTCEADCGQCLGYEPGNIIISEIFKNPRAITDPKGEWFELRNMTASPIDLTGWKIADGDGDQHVINPTPDLILGVGGQAGMLVLGSNANTNTNCGVDVDYEYTNFTLDNDGTDGIMLIAPDGTIIDEVFYNDVDFFDVPGYSLMLSPTKQGAELNDNGANWCLGWLSLSCGDWGTPGVPSLTCKAAPVCGDGTPDFGETCDDGNTKSGDGCSDTCQNETAAWCGNGDLEFGEACDDGNVESFDGCSSYCQVEAASVCGNGQKEGSEECDDGNKKNGDGCDSNCLLEAGCGDGIIDQDAGEQCDPPNPPDCSAECQLGYTDPLCGDGYKHELEECDDGCMWGMAHVCEPVTDDGDGCSHDCKLEGTCGNGQLDELEECDDGNKVPGDGCDENCLSEGQVPACQPSPCCGDFQVDAGEECDDGNLDLDDGCDDLCKIEAVVVCEPSPCCGDGETDPGEECDDANLDLNDGCDTNCKLEGECGNGVPEPPGEECDDGNKVPGDGCSPTCEWETNCGNNQIEMGEECDDGNKKDGDGCSAQCTLELDNTTALSGTVTFPGGQLGAENMLYIGLLDGTNPDDFEPVQPFDLFNQYFVVTELPYDYKVYFPNLPTGSYYVIAFLDVNNDNGFLPDGTPGDPNEGDADVIYVTPEQFEKVPFVAGQTTTGINLELLEIPPPPQ